MLRTRKGNDGGRDCDRTYLGGRVSCVTNEAQLSNIQQRELLQVSERTTFKLSQASRALNGEHTHISLKEGTASDTPSRDRCFPNVFGGKKGQQCWYSSISTTISNGSQLDGTCEKYLMFETIVHSASVSRSWSRRLLKVGNLLILTIQYSSVIVTTEPVCLKAEAVTKLRPKSGGTHPSSRLKGLGKTLQQCINPILHGKYTDKRWTASGRGVESVWTDYRWGNRSIKNLYSYMLVIVDRPTSSKQVDRSSRFSTTMLHPEKLLQKWLQSLKRVAQGINTQICKALASATLCIYS